MTHYTPRLATDAMIAPPKPKSVSMPALPFAVPPDAIDETKPATPPVRRKMRKVSKPKTMPCNRPVFDHGEDML